MKNLRGLYSKLKVIELKRGRCFVCNCMEKKQNGATLCALLYAENFNALQRTSLPFTPTTALVRSMRPPNSQYSKALLTHDCIMMQT